MKASFQIILLIIFLIIFFPKIAASGGPLTLKPIEGSHSVGFDQNNLGILNYKKKQFGRALKHFHIASMADQKNGEIYFNIALTLNKLNELNDIGKYLRLAVKYSPHNEDITKSTIFKLFNCNNNSPCDPTPPKPFRIEGSGTHYLK
tara:strand:- start:1118 stop:1558 length:441 start_codon:yes stop_codon:yes gene_type:complete